VAAHLARNGQDDITNNYESLSELNEELLGYGVALCWTWCQCGWRFLRIPKAKSTRSYLHICSKVQQQEAMQWLQENAFASPTWLVFKTLKKHRLLWIY
jgi:hypothetical protein